GGAGVVAGGEAADADAVLAAAGRVGHLVVAEDAITAEVLDAELALDGPLPADVDLFFAEHARPSEPGTDGERVYPPMIPDGRRKRMGSGQRSDGCRPFDLPVDHAVRDPTDSETLGAIGGEEVDAAFAVQGGRRQLGTDADQGLQCDRGALHVLVDADLVELGNRAGGNDRTEKLVSRRGRHDQAVVEDRPALAKVLQGRIVSVV